MHPWYELGAHAAVAARIGCSRHAHQRHAVRTLLAADASEQTAARRYCMQRARRADAPDACNGRTL